MIAPAMTELRDYSKPFVPRDVAAQIRSYVRIQWPFLDARDGKLWDVPPDSTTRTFVVLDGETLASHAEANFRTVDHMGETFNVGGISAVFTYPAYRNGGSAREVVRAATAFLDRSDADLAMLFCGEPLRTFYGSCGWDAVDAARILRGDRAAPTVHEGNLVMMRFISAKGRAARTAFESQPVYVGERTW
jgi:predicted acetyltransferase